MGLTSFRQRLLASSFALSGVIAAWAATPASAAVEYVKVCSLYGANYMYSPGTDRCAYTAPLGFRTATQFGVLTNLGGTGSSVYGVNGFAGGNGSSAFGGDAFAGGNPNGQLILPAPIRDPTDPSYDANAVAFYDLNHGVINRNGPLYLVPPTPPSLSDPNYAADLETYQSDLAHYNQYNGQPGSVFYPSAKFPSTEFTNAGATAVGQGAQAGAGAAGEANATAVGQAASANAANATAVGQGASANAANSTAIGQGASATASGAVAIGQGSVADQANTVSFGSSDLQRRLVNVAAGVNATDAVNVGQLNAAVLDIVGNEASVNGGNTAGLAGAHATGEGAYAGGFGSQADGQDTTALGTGAKATSAGAVAVGAGAQATADPTTAVGNLAAATANNASAFGGNATASGVNSLALGQGSTASATGAAAIGQGAHVTAANSVALGTGSTASRGAVADYDADGMTTPQTSAGEVSVGSAGAERQITTVAAGQAPTDAANVGQVQGAVASANAYTDSQFRLLGSQVDEVRQRADSGTAAAMALAGLTQAVTPGKSMVTGGVGTWRGETALAFGASHRFDHSVTVKIGGAFATRGGGGMNAAVGYEF